MTLGGRVYFGEWIFERAGFVQLSPQLLWGRVGENLFPRSPLTKDWANA